MDLKSMLNDSSGHKKPPAPAPSLLNLDQSSGHPGRSDVPRFTPDRAHNDRPTPYAPPLQPPDQRSPGGSSYLPLQSPYQNNTASTPTLSAGAQSAHSQNPGTIKHAYTSREGVPLASPYNASFAPAGSPLAPQPSTPGTGQYYHQNYPPPQSTPTAHDHHIAGPHHPHHPTSIPTNGLHTPQTRQISPSAHANAQQSTQLGPPAGFQRPASQTQRPPSQGFDHYRTFSSSSVGSAQGKDFGHVDITSPQQLRRESLQRHYSVEREIQRERERSISVSPKTIPRPSPNRQISSESRRMSQVTPPIYHKQETEETAVPPMATIEVHVDATQSTATPKSLSETPRDVDITSHSPSARPSPATGVVSLTATPKSTAASLPPQQSPRVQKQPNLKRNASVVSAMSLPSQPARKKPRRDEIPIFARSARPHKPPRLIRGPSAPIKTHQPAPVVSSSSGTPTSNGNTSTPGGTKQAIPRWEPSILNVTPYEDITRKICDWIVQEIGNAAPPSGGAMFEIEAKIGEIYDSEEGGRIRLPIETEAVFNRDKWKRTKFESSMNMAQHKQLNEFLNGLVQESHAQSDRTPIFYDHPREADEFFELSPVGIAHLPPSITRWLNPRHKPRVRKTIDLKTNKVKAQIIKSRIADLEVYNPGSDFDYRISISIESPWEGDPGWLEEMRDTGRERNKDRVSYRHMAYQIDLTQVSYAGRADKEHELEVEISTEQIRRELENLRMQRESKYEDLVRGFIDNVRILCRKGTIGRH